jgi:hypothetical protein
MSGNGNKKGGGGGKKSTPAEKVKHTNHGDVVERYKEINDSLDDIEKNLKRINRESDKLFGAARLKQMDKALE